MAEHIVLISRVGQLGVAGNLNLYIDLYGFQIREKTQDGFSS